MNPFENFIKFGVIFPKSNVKFPKEWQKLTISQYNNEENYAILTGKINNIIVIDLDIKGNILSIEWFEKYFCKINDINTLTTKSINGGYHIFYKYSDSIKSTSFKEYNVDILSDNRCCFQGQGYEIIIDCGFEIKELSQEQIDILNKSSIATMKKEKDNQSFSEEEISEILDGLHDNRSNDRESWIKVGYILTNYPDFGEKLFLKFSKRSNLFNAQRHQIDWNSLVNSRTNSSKVTIGTVIYWLKEDNPTLYHKLLTKKDNSKILKELNTIVNNSKDVNMFDITHTELIKQSKTSIEALIQYNLGLNPIHNLQNPSCSHINLYTECTKNGLKFKCYNCNFEYPPQIIPVNKDVAPVIYNTLVINENIKNKDTSQVANKIKEKVELVFFNKEWFKYEEYNGIYIPYYREQVINLIDSIGESFAYENDEWLSWIQKISYKETLIRELESKCFKIIHFDDNPFILGFKNGVFDLKSNTFRKGLKNEYISMSCGYDYSENFDTSLAYSFLSDIFPVKEELDYAINVFSFVLEGINRKQIITFNYGFTASNGKSYLMERIRNSLGDYGDSFSVNLLTNKMKNAGDSNSTLINFKNKRFLYCSEPEAGAKLNTNFVKSLTGDSIKARGLYSSKEDLLKCTYNIFVCCNVLPNFDSCDEGIIRRITLLDYKTKFCEKPRKNKNEKILKKYTKEEEQYIEKGILHILLKNYLKLKQNSFDYNEPLYISDMRNLYLDNNKDTISNILLENYKIGTYDDYVRLCDIKKLLECNNIKEKDAFTIKMITLETFDNALFYNRKIINNNDCRKIFIYLKNI